MFNIVDTLKTIILGKKIVETQNQNMAKLPYKELRKKLKQEMKDLTTEYVKNGKGYLGSSAYLKIRSTHIAYSMYRGHKFEEVERSWKHQDSWINIYVKQVAFQLLESYKAQTLSQDESNEQIIYHGS